MHTSRAIEKSRFGIIFQLILFRCKEGIPKEITMKNCSADFDLIKIERFDEIITKPARYKSIPSHSELCINSAIPNLHVMDTVKLPVFFFDKGISVVALNLGQRT